MADSDHVAAVADPKAELHPETEINMETGNGHQVVRGAGPRTPSLPGHAQDCEGAESTGEFQHEHGGSASPKNDLHVEPCVSQPRVCYPLNSKRLTGWHLRTLTYLGIH